MFDEADGSGSGDPSSDASGDPTPTTSAASSEPGSSSADSSASTTAETGDGDPPPVLPAACALVRVDGEARLQLPQVNNAPSTLRIQVIDAGSAQTPARILTIQDETLGDSHNNYRAHSYVFESWPDGVLETEPPLRLTRAGHYVSRLVSLDDDANRFAYVWTGDPGGINAYDTFYSILDVFEWQVTEDLEIVASTSSGFVDLLGVPNSTRMLATLETNPFETTPDEMITGFSLAVLDIEGSKLAGPAPLTLQTPTPGSDMRTFWAGDRVAAAVGHNACGDGDPLCSPHAVVLARPTAPDEHGLGADGFAISHVIDGQADTQFVSRPMVSSFAGLTWVIWYEGTDWTGDDEQRRVRGIVLDAHGDPRPWPLEDPSPDPITFVPPTSMSSYPNVLVSELGITAVHRTQEQTFVLQQHDFAFAPLGPPIVLERDSHISLYPAMATLAEPRSLLLVWGEQVEDAASLRMLRFECADG